MGIALRARSPLKKKGLFSSAVSIEQVAAALVAAAKGTPLEAIVATGKLRDGASILFHPGGNPVDLRADGEGFAIDTETSLLGPGYHAFVVSALDSLQSKLGLRWAWDDATGYAENRDFGRLQAMMAEAMRHAAKALSKRHDEQGDRAELKLCMPEDFGAIAAPGEVLTPLGPTTIQMLRQALSEGDFREVAADLTVWWNQAFDGDFFRGIALYSLWNEARWATPRHQEEVRAIERTVDWCIKALQLGADLPVSKASLQELVALSKSKDAIAVPPEQGMGYRRRPWKREFRGWQLTMPGALQPSVDMRDGVAFVFSTPGLDIRATADQAPADDPEVIGGRLDGEITLVERKPDEPNQTATVMSLGKTFPKGSETAVCRLTITSTNPEMRALGERIGKSLTYLPANS